MVLAARTSQIQPSATLEIDAKAKALKAQGKDIVGFGAGEPDFDTPDNIKEAAYKAIKEGKTKYTPVGGTDELKEAIIEKFKNDHGVSYQKPQIVVSCGAKHTLYNIACALFQEGDEVIIPSPYWVSYPDQVRLMGATPVFADTSKNGFRVNAEAVKPCITKRTKAIIVNSPCNPTGAVSTRADLESLAKLAVDKNIFIISDEIYEKIIYDDAEHFCLASFGEDIKKLSIIVNGVSKTYAMTGWRIGYAACPTEIASAMNKIQSQSTSNPTSIAQIAAEEALRGPQHSVKMMVEQFGLRRAYIYKKLNSIPGVKCPNPMGAFYAFPDVSGLYGKKYEGKEIKNSLDLTAYFLEKALVAVVPGGPFGEDKCLRLSYATSMETIIQGLNRIEAAVAKLS